MIRRYCKWIVPVAGTWAVLALCVSQLQANDCDQCDAPCASCDSQDCCENSCGDCLGSWLDNTQIWIGGESFKGLGDSLLPSGTVAGFTNSAGLVSGFNTGFGLGDSRIRAQVGASFGLYDLKGRDTVTPSSLEQQYFITAGFYKRSDICNDERISWAVVYDQFIGHQWGLFADNVAAGQIRSLAGYALNDSNEVGVWTTVHIGTTSTTNGTMRAMNQGNLYWRHNYEFGGSTMGYVGAVDPADVGSWQFGFLGTAPLNHKVSLYGNYVYSFPGSATGFVGSSDELWSVSAGLMFSFGGKAFSKNISGQQGLPLLSVANNGSLMLTN